jgi:short-subunit dehydrogenase
MNIVITGASKGIGKAIAKAFAEKDFTVLICSRQQESLDKAILEIQAQHPTAVIVGFQADLSEKSQAIAFADWCNGFGPADILVNNAGSYLPGNVSDEPDGTLENMIDTNLYSAYHVTRALLPKMKLQKRGHIFNMCSIASLAAYPGGGAYSISKFALYGFNKNLREELKPYGIKVTALIPGAVMTDSWANFDNTKGRIMEVSDIANMVLASSTLSPQAVVEDIIFRPQLGDL